VIAYGIFNFDNIGSAIKAVLLIIATDSWNSHMANLINADSPSLAGIYCIFLVVIGTYILLNLVLAVIISAFIKIEQVEIKEQIMNAQEF
jgi:hypothetical protein